jgi:hypothetical protein
LLRKAAADGGQGWAAFEKLFKECDRRILGSLLVWLIAPQKITFKSGAKAPTEEDQHAKRNKLKSFYFPAVESSKELLYPITPSELNSIVRRTQAFERDVERLRRTRFVRFLVLDGTLADDPLLGGPLLPKLQSDSFRGILALPELARRLGQRRRPDYTRYLTAVYRHIFDCTGTWHDKEVADLLNDLRPHPQKPYTQEGLKRWRSLQRVRP